jgi:NAD(P)-dependent dehydrogenase (short-subunit alcohol dehydrogenase family)
MAGRLAAKTALVTGAARGIGRAIAAALAAEGAEVFPATRTDADISQPEQVTRLFENARRRFPRLDILVNNAGVAEAAPLVETSDAVWQRMIGANLSGMFYCCRSGLAWMIPQRAGHIVNILSVAAIEAFPGNAAYCASKFGALGLSRVLREEARAQGILVTAILPGAVDTPLWDAYWPEAPRQRMMRPEAVAEAVLAALTLSPDSVAEEIILRPPAGRL